jgi:choline monooxygenase
MWVHKTRLPHLLPPEAYVSGEHHERELARVFLPAWHCVTTLDELPGEGDFVTRELLGRPIIVHNDRGEPRAFLNVCAHRHALLTHAPRGTMRRLRCQYHGWEYDSEGAACKVPDAACFVPIRKGQERLKALRTEVLGKLVFASLAEAGPGLREFLGERAFLMGERAFGRQTRLGVSLELEHPCNWKVPLENVLESYHVPCLHDNFVARHPGLFRFFRGRREGAGESHELGEGFSAVHDVLGADSALYRGLVRRLRPEASFEFVHLHSFPNLLFGQTSLVSFLQVVTPVSPAASRSMVRIFLDLGQPGRGPLERLAAPLADRLASALFAMLMREDSPIYPDVQRGMVASPHPGVLGSREERIYHFHQHLARVCGLETVAPAADAALPDTALPGA